MTALFAGQGKADYAGLFDGCVRTINSNMGNIEFSAIKHLGNNIWTGLYSNSDVQTYAGYFDGDVNINGRLLFGNYNAPNPDASIELNNNSDLLFNTNSVN